MSHIRRMAIGFIVSLALSLLSAPSIADDQQVVFRMRHGEQASNEAKCRAILRQRDRSLRAIYLLTRPIGIVVSCVMAWASFSKVVSAWLILTVAETPVQKGRLCISLHRCQYLSQPRKPDNGLGV